MEKLANGLLFQMMGWWKKTMIARVLTGSSKLFKHLSTKAAMKMYRGFVVDRMGATLEIHGCQSILPSCNRKHL